MRLVSGNLVNQFGCDTYTKQCKLGRWAIFSNLQNDIFSLPIQILCKPAEDPVIAPLTITEGRMHQHHTGDGLASSGVPGPSGDTHTPWHELHTQQTAAAAACYGSTQPTAGATTHSYASQQEDPHAVRNPCSQGAPMYTKEESARQSFRRPPAAAPSASTSHWRDRAKSVAKA
jgi:hypothetical protein